MNLTQDHNTVGVYFTKLKTICEELNNYRPMSSYGKCSFGGVKNLNSHYQMEYVMSFLMGLNDTFAQVRGQLLLMDPLPPINKVFALVSQEEHQRKVGNLVTSGSDSISSVAFAVKAEIGKGTGNFKANSGTGNQKGHKRDKPFCTHCNYHGHIVDRCYKLHRYPLGYKQRQRDNNANSVVVNQVATEIKHDNQSVVGGLIQTLNPDQYQHLISMFSSHLASTSKATNDQHQDAPSTSYVVATSFATGKIKLATGNQLFTISAVEDETPVSLGWISRHLGLVSVVNSKCLNQGKVVEHFQTLTTSCSGSTGKVASKRQTSNPILKVKMAEEPRLVQVSK
ncbi:hypothetical protein LWI29_033604 [Acer saccharum]|uniref:Uncharacterized protein n=1 Tax=Acer saccharum TaxID=4024 RepID=A0AA39S5N9_ACESA|nr:hypothetical protein LWI29_033604 [Acer saccharum]